MTKNVKKITLSTIAVGIAGLSILFYNTQANATSKVNFNQDTTQLNRITPNSNQILSYHDIIKEPMESVVNITVKLKPQPSRESTMMDDPFFRQFANPRYRNAPQKENIPKGAGSGVVLTNSGYIATNNHVVDGATEILVTFNSSKKEYKAKLIGRDKGSDLAVIKIEANDLLPAKVGNMKDVRVGDVVFAIGNPFGVGETVTSGIVSALNKNGLGINQYENFIQTDASINPGNSGGALVDSRGVVIGINSAIFSKGGGNDGIGFAIPIDMVKNIVTQIVDSGKVSRGYMGISLKPLDSNLAKSYNSNEGVVVGDVEYGGSASKAGIKSGDLIVAVDGVKIDTPSKLQMAIGDKKPNESAVITIERNRAIKNLTIKLGNQEEVLTKSFYTIDGMTLALINSKIREDLSLAQSNGVVVLSVEADSLMKSVGFRAGDVIIQVENDTISTIDEARKSLSKNGTKRVFVNRYGKIGVISIK